MKSRWSCRKDLVAPEYSLGAIVVAGVICDVQHLIRAEALDPEIRNAIREPYDTALHFLESIDYSLVVFKTRHFHVLEVEDISELSPQVDQAFIGLHPSVLSWTPSDKPSVPALCLVTLTQFLSRDFFHYAQSSQVVQDERWTSARAPKKG